MATEKPLARPSDFGYFGDTEYNRSQRVEARLKNAYACARSFHLTHDQLLENIKTRIYETSDFKRLKPYYRGRFAGLNDALRDALWAYHLTWHVFYAGKLIPSKEVPEGQWNQVVSDSGQFVWADKPECLFTTPKAKEVK